MGAAGRDFHNFNMVYRENSAYDVVAFTATQIPDIDGRKYPASLAGKLYPKGIRIYDETELPELIKERQVREVVFSYSDVSYNYVMGKSAIVTAAGADFKLLGARLTMLKSKKPVIAVCAVRTGSGKSQTTRKIAKLLQAMGKKVVAIRHPMPYGDIAKQKVQRFASLADLKKHNCTIEEIEEYEPHIVTGTIIYSGVDYAAILAQAEKEANVILWDGGNNDLPFYEPDLHIVVTDPLRVGNELSYYPGEANLRMADVVIINKIDTAKDTAINDLRANIKLVNRKARIIEAASPVFVHNHEIIEGKNVLVVEDGPTLTHGNMQFGAGVVAASKYRCKKIIDPRPYIIGTIKDTFKKYPNIGHVLPAMGYGKKQMRDLRATINKTPCDLVIIGTPIDLRRIIKIKKPTVRVSYDLEEIGTPNLLSVLREFVRKRK